MNLVKKKNTNDMNYRVFIQRVVYRLLDPMLLFLLRCHVTPNVVTVAGFVGNAVAACLLACGCALWGGTVILLSGLMDMMDGRLARLGGLSSPFGALLDSSLDRYSELLTLSGVAMLLFRAGGDWLWAVAATFGAIAGSMMVSYVRARAEGLGVECKTGFMQRPERVVVTAVAAVAAGATADLMWLAAGMTAIAVLSNVTALWRLKHCHDTMDAAK